MIHLEKNCININRKLQMKNRLTPPTNYQLIPD
jgi:hypothetical protein